MFLVLDNTVLSNFSLAGRIDLLAQLSAERVVTVDDAWNEWQVGIRLGRIPLADMSWLPVLELDESEQKVRDELVPPLDLGEAECLALAKSRGYALLTDDRVARREARRLGVPLSGTIGALVSLVDDHLLTLAEANHLLQQMIAFGYRSPLQTLSD